MASTDNVPPAADAVGSNSEATPETTAATIVPQSSDETGKESFPVASNNGDNNTPSEATETAPQEDTPAHATESAGDATPTPAPPTTTTTTSAGIKTGEESEVVAVTEGETSDQSQAAAAAAAAKEDSAVGPELVITLLLTTGARHPFKIDAKYLRGRSVNVENDDPFNMSVYTLKELIWREWRSEWEPRPSSPSYIRLISFGKLLDDKSQLSDSSLTHDAPNVIHMTVKPQEVADEEDTKGGKSYSGRDRDAADRSPGCRCIIL
ncbi:uncharacterized protein TRUGW13939_06349 [Talaromyces rugulosus]|uniref:UBL3-like ubiquitin domain-containing protein n=1 Tax=Talaromyces rugulosus TaxID=121627 RepID=A0A7H8QZ23_TALRU|nr:uncharacterized protein TRUGW13939_06349 [Talaromyces rugulosus]QKX59217.1 hypothetical protein TRUGW13939_06349 [Talaromyces rugulosus]